MADKPYPNLAFNDDIDWKHVSPKILSSLNNLAASTGTVINVTSGYRTYQHQKQLYQRYVDSGYDIRYIAAPPGKSAHESGNAVDATVNGTGVGNAFSAKTLGKYGLSAPVKGDPVHIQLLSYKGGSSKSQPTPNGDVTTTSGSTKSPSVNSNDAVFFDTRGSRPADTQQAGPSLTSGPSGLDGQGLASLWESIANQQFSSPETNLLAQNAKAMEQ